MNTANLLLGCIQCGRCSGSCPVSIKSPLNIRKLLYSFLLNPKAVFDAEKSGIWECTTCTTCNLRCPKSCAPLNLILDTRTWLVEKGRIDSSIIKALESTYLHGNPFGKAREKRIEWIHKIDTPIKILTEGSSADYLLFICCINAYDPRMQKVTKSIVKVLSSLGVDFGILGEAENCCGSEIKRMGESGLFAELKEKNLLSFSKIKIKGIITISPHCYNTLKNEYDISIPVEHYTTFLSNEGARLRKMNFVKSKEVGLFHDPCFLGKMNNIYEPPRALLKASLAELKEFDRAKEKSLCCEGGGGRMWIESKVKGRLAEKRVSEAKGLGINKIYVACPFCLSTLEDAVKVMGEEDNIKIEDIAELLADGL